MAMLQSKLPGVGTNIFSRMTALAGECGAINLSQGFPGFAAPEALRRAMAHHAIHGHNQYAPLAGLPALREILAEQLHAQRGVSCDPESEITITPGATVAIYCAITACINRDDEVILLDPCYDSYEPAITLCGARAVHVPLDPVTFAPDWQRIEDAVTPRTRMIIINSPHNPTGSVLSRADIEALAALCERHDLLVVSDEVYDALVYDGAQHHSVLQHEALRQRSFAVFSFGKTLGVTGWKTGYCVAPAALSRELRRVHQFVCFVAVTPVQQGIADFLRADPGYATALADTYQPLRDTFCAALAGSRFRLRPSAGTYFQLLDYSAISDEPDTTVCETWTREHGVACIPVSVFSQAPPQGQRLLRFCFAKPEAELLEAAERLCRI
jgi:methionine aminotransferase